MKSWKQIRTWIVMLPVLAVTLESLRGEDTWDGGGVGSAWSTPENWADDTAPDTANGGVITFNDTAVGSTNLVDQDWTIASLNYENTTVGSAHTTVVANAVTLIVSNGALRVGNELDDTLVAIQGPGTVQVGTADSPAKLEVGSDGLSHGVLSDRKLTVGCTLNTRNVGHLHVGVHVSTYAGSSSEATLDLSAGRVDTGGTANTLAASAIVIGGGGGRSPAGTLRLPPTVTEISAGTLEMAAGYASLGGLATLDLGAGSQLNTLSVSDEFYFGKDGRVTLIGWPTGVDVTVGKSDSDAPMTVGCSEGESDCGATLALTNGSFTAYLSSLKIGCNRSTGSGDATGVLDLENTTVQIGDTPDKVKVAELRIGGGGGFIPNGTLRLPSSVTEIAVGTLEMAAGYSSAGGTATLGLGPASQLNILTVSNAFYLGKNGPATLIGWPTGVDVTVGQSDAYASMTVGCSEGESMSVARLAMTNGSFTAYLSALQIGCNSRQAGDATGVLDLENTTVQIGDTPDKVKVAELRIGGGAGYSPNGILRLPSNVTDIVVETLEMAAGYSTAGGVATLDLGNVSQLATLTVSDEFLFGFNGPATLEGWPAGVTVTVGTPGTPARMVVGASANEFPAGASLVLTNGSFTGYLSSLEVGNNRGSVGGTSGTLDLRHTTLGALELSGNALIGSWNAGNNLAGKGYAYLPAGSVTVGDTLYVGDTHVNSYGLLELNGTAMRVDRRVEIEQTGRVTSRIAGTAGGIDLRSSDTADLVIANGGSMHLSFDSDPVSPGVYWGLKMQGDATAYFQELIDDSRVTYDIGGLSPRNAALFGVHYDPNGFSYIGFRPPPAGTTIILR